MQAPEAVAAAAQQAEAAVAEQAEAEAKQQAVAPAKRDRRAEALAKRQAKASAAELSPKQQLVLELFSDPLDRRSEAEKAEACGVSRHTLWRWKLEVANWNDLVATRMLERKHELVAPALASTIKDLTSKHPSARAAARRDVYELNGLTGKAALLGLQGGGEVNIAVQIVNEAGEDSYHHVRKLQDFRTEETE